jgi:hypothetical protein
MPEKEFSSASLVGFKAANKGTPASDWEASSPRSAKNHARSYESWLKAVGIYGAADLRW